MDIIQTLEEHKEHIRELQSTVKLLMYYVTNEAKVSNTDHSLCDFCGETYEQNRKTHRFCSTKCRVASHRQKQLGDIDYIQPAFENNKGSHFIYFIEGNNQIKIGISTNYMDRLSALQSGSPIVLKLLGVIPGGYKKEKKLHRRFAHIRLHGEWFEAAPELLKYIEENAENY